MFVSITRRTLAGLVFAVSIVGCSGDGAKQLPTAASAAPRSDTTSTAGRDSTDSTPVAKPVAHFDLTVMAFGPNSASDTTTAIPLPGSILTLSQAGDDSSLVGTAVADANGAAAFLAVPRLPPSSLRATPPGPIPHH